LAEFRDVSENTPCTVCHRVMACLPHWCCWTVLPDGVIHHNCLQKLFFFHTCVHGRRKDFFQGWH